MLERNGSVSGHLKISEAHGVFAPPVEEADRFASSVAWLDNFDPNGGIDLAVGTPGDDDGGDDRGAVWVLSIEEAPEPSPRDCDGDGQVGITDLLALLSQWGGPGSCDIDGNGTVDILDLLALLANWGPCG